MQKGSAALFLLLIGLAVTGLLGAFVFGLVKLPAPQIPQLPLKTPASVPKFQTYTNQKLGFEFQYPGKDFSVSEDSEEEYNKRGNGDFRKNFTGYVGYSPAPFLGAVVVLEKDKEYDASPFTVWVFDNSNNLTIDTWFQNYWYYPFLWGVFDWTSKGHISPDQEATISGQIAKYKIVSYQPGKPKFIYVANEKKMYLFRLIGKGGDEILSTFKFLDRNTGIPLGPESEAFFNKVGERMQKLGTPSAPMESR